MRSGLFLLVVLTVKVRHWELRKVQDKRASWEELSKILYILRSLMEREFVRYVGVQ